MRFTDRGCQGGSTMNDDSEIDLGLFRRLLLERREALLEVAGAGAEAADTVELDQTRVGRLSRMDALQSQAMSVETNRRRALELQRIEGALQRMETGDYGYCLECGELIPKQRLEFDPAAPLCVACAEQSETGV